MGPPAPRPLLRLCRAQRFYRAMGYREVGRFAGQIRKGVRTTDEVWFERELALRP